MARLQCHESETKRQHHRRQAKDKSKSLLCSAPPLLLPIDLSELLLFAFERQARVVDGSIPLPPAGFDIVSYFDGGGSAEARIAQNALSRYEANIAVCEVGFVSSMRHPFSRSALEPLADTEVVGVCPYPAGKLGPVAQDSLMRNLDDVLVASAVAREKSDIGQALNIGSFILLQTIESSLLPERYTTIEAH